MKFFGTKNEPPAELTLHKTVLMWHVVTVSGHDYVDWEGWVRIKPPHNDWAGDDDIEPYDE